MRRLPTLPPRLRGGAADPRRSRPHRALHRDVAIQCTRPLRRLAGRGLDHHGRGRGAHPGGEGQLPSPRDDRGVRHRRGDPGPSQLRRLGGVRGRRVRPSRVHSLARYLHPDLRARRGGLRAARLPDRPAPAARGPDGLPRRPSARRPRLHGLPGMQGKGYGLPHGRSGHPLPRARDPERMRGVVPLDRSRLLWLFRSGGYRQHRVTRRADPGRRCLRLGDLAPLSHLQCGGPGLPPGVDGARTVGAGDPDTVASGRQGGAER